MDYEEKDDPRVGFRNNPDVRGRERPAKRQLGVSIQSRKQDLGVTWSGHWKPLGCGSAKKDLEADRGAFSE